MIIELDTNSIYFAQTMQIYEASFPAWEKEPQDAIRKRLQNGRYRLFAYIKGHAPFGFYIFDLHPKLDYILFTYLAVDETKRGKGIGTKLCMDAMERFRSKTDYGWMFIEAEDRQARFYAKLGFVHIDIDYSVPRYDNDGVISMHLLCLQKEKKELTKEFLSKVIVSIYTEGYFLEINDKRIENQLQKLPNKITFSKEFHVKV